MSFEKHAWLWLLAVCATLIVTDARPAHAQSDFTTAPVAVGDIVKITIPSSGTTISGPLTAITASTLTVDTRQIGHEPGLRIARKGDSLLNGVVIGAAIGAAAGATIAAEACLDTSIAYCVIGGAAGYAGLGALIDWLHKGFTDVYREPQRSRVQLLPSVGPGGASVRVSLAFR
jgi:hypothetical protein